MNIRKTTGRLLILTLVLVAVAGGYRWLLDQYLVGAAMGGNTARAAQLLRAGASPRARGHADVSALEHAASGGHREIVALLLAHGADPTDRESWLRAPDVATRRGRIAVLRLLVQAGLEVNLRNRHGETPLVIAVTGRNRAAVRLLLDAGSDVHLTDEAGKDAADYAKEGADPVIRTWIRRAEIAQRLRPHAQARPGEARPVPTARATHPAGK